MKNIFKKEFVLNYRNVLNTDEKKQKSTLDTMLKNINFNL
jgi:hypothetical protein